MKTLNETTAKLSHSITIEKGKEKTVIQITLNDDCKNGHEDFSLTADIYEKTARGWRDVGGGCCHEHILSLRPDLAPFAALHLATCDGVPMHAIANAWYWFCGFGPGVSTEKYHGGSGSGAKLPEECRAIFRDHIRATDEQVSSIVGLAPRSQVELQVILEDMRFPTQWKAEADAAIAQLEAWTGGKFESRATRGRWEPVSDEKRGALHFNAVL